MIITWKFDPHLGPPHVVLITEGIKTCNIFHPIFKRKNKEHYFWETSAAPGESFLSVHMTFPERTTYMTSRVCTASFYITAATGHSINSCGPALAYKCRRYDAACCISPPYRLKLY